MPRHNRERAGAENCFDELKNQWGWAGYTSHRFSSSQIMAPISSRWFTIAGILIRHVWTLEFT
jgi:hypothetical protein